MGQPKQLLSWDGITLLQHAIKTCKKTVSKDIFVVLGAHQDAIVSKIKKASVNIVFNSEWALGLGKSIASATKFLCHSEKKIEGVLIVLADQPFVTSSFLNDMMYQFTPNSCEIIATSYKSGKSGVPVLFDKTYFPELSKLSGDDGAKLILKKHNASVKVITPDFENIDIDTKEDYLHLKRGIIGE